MPRSRELSSVNTSVQKAMMWSGTYLKFSGTGENPYAKQDGHRETLKHIEPMFDATNAILTKDILDGGLIFTVDKMRTYLQEQLDALMEYMTNTERLAEKEINYTNTQLVNTNMCMFNIYTNITEARMWLGMELGRIRDEGIENPKARA